MLCYSPPAFIQLPNLPIQFKSIKAYDNHALLLDIEGNVWHYGEDISGRNQHCDEPQKRENVSNLVAIETGVSHNLALDVDGHVWSWGQGPNGQLGHGDLPRLTNPKRWCQTPQIFENTHVHETYFFLGKHFLRVGHKIADDHTVR